MFKRNLHNRISFLNRLYNDTERKPLFQIVLEVFTLFIRQKTFPTYYFSRHLYKSRVQNIHDYLPNKRLLPLHKELNNQFTIQVLENKLFFYLFFNQVTSNLAKVLMYNHRNIFIIDNRIFEINTAGEFQSLVFDLVDKISRTKSIFIKKTYDSYGGKNTYRILREDFPLPVTFVNELFSEIKNSGYLFQETIRQHPELNRLNPSCVNTIRMDTFIDQEGHVEIISPYLRMSTNNLHVDNISSGGCFVGVNPDGKLKKLGYTSISKMGGSIFTAHPVTKVVFQDIEIPYYYEAKQLVIQVAKLLPDLRLIGWDIAITETGPLLIEGNYGYDITNHDLSYGGYKANPVFRKVLKELKLI